MRYNITDVVVLGIPATATRIEPFMWVMCKDCRTFVQYKAKDSHECPQHEG
jgi:hypothetical protein